MENQNQNPGVAINNGGPQVSPPVSAYADTGASLDADVPVTAITTDATTATVQNPKQNVLVRLAKRADVILAILLILGSIGLVIGANTTQQKEGVRNQYDPIEIPLNDLQLSDQGELNLTSKIVTINGAFVVAPSLQPSSATPGQIYYDQTSNQLAYYNGSKFVPVSDNVNTVQSVGGLTGQVQIGGGLNVAGGQLSNSGVLSVQGLAGNVTLTAGNGIEISGTTISNNGVISVSSSTPALVVSDDGNGNITLSGSSSGTVSSPGGTAGRLAKFTGAQTVADSLISESGMTVTVNGDLSVITGGLSLSNALTVSNGGTGTTSLALNGVLLGQGTGAITSVTSGGAGLCLISTAGAPAFSACPGGGGVSSLNGLTGGLSIANASGAGNTITIDDASTSVKGIAQFSSTNFNVGSGIVNTIQNINSGATPTFAGVNTNNITPSAALTVGATGQTLTLQGNASTQLSATGGGFTTTLGFSGVPTGPVNYNLDRAATPGTYTLCSTAGNCVGAGGGVSTSGGAINRLAKFTGSQVINNSTISDDGITVTTSVDLEIQGGAVTIGVPNSQTGLINLAHNGSGFVGTITQGVLTDDRTYTLPNASGEFCLTSGNCSGSGSTNTLQAAYNAGNSLTTTNARDIDIVLANTTTDSNFDLVIDDGSTGFVSITRANGAGTADPAQLLLIDNLDTDRSIAAGLKVQSAAGTIATGLDVSDSEIGDAINAGSNNIVGTTGNLDFTNFDVQGSSGNISAAGNMNLSGGGQYQISGVQISSANLSNDANLAKLNASQTFTGNTNAFQNGADSVNAFNVQNAAGTRLLTVNTTGGLVELGTSSALDGQLVFRNASNGNTVTIMPGTPSGPRTITLPNDSGIVCLNTGNCAGAGATLQTAYNFSVGGTTPKIKVNTTLGSVDIQADDAGSVASLFNIRASNAGGLGSVLFGVGNTGQTTFQNASNSDTALRVLSSGGTSVLTVDTTNGQILLGQSSTLTGAIVFRNSTNTNTTTLTTAAATGGPQTITLPDGTGTVCISTGNCSGSGSTNTLQAAYDAGNTINASTGRDIAFNLTDQATDPNFLVDLQCDTSCGANGRFALQDDGVDILSVAPTAINIGSATTNVPVTISSGTGTINIGNGAQARTVDIGTGAAAQTVTLGSTNTTSTTLIQGGTGNITLNSGGTIALQDTTTIAGNLTVTGTAASALIVKASTAGTGAVVADFQQSDNDSIMRLTDTGTLGIGTTGGIVGIVALSSGTAFGEIRATNVTAARILQLPNVSGTFCTDAGNCGTTTGTLQNAYSYSAGSTTPEIKLDTTRNGIEIQDADTTIGSGQNFLSLRGPNSGGLGSVLVGFGTQGNLFMQPSTDRVDLIDINTNGGANLLTVNSLNSRVGIALGSTNLPTHTLDVGGNTNLRGSSSGDALTVSNATSTGSILVLNDNTTAVVTIADGGAAQFRNQTNSATAFQVQNATGADTLFTVDTAARSASGGNLIKVGNSTGTDGNLTVLQLDATTANPTSNLSALNGGLFYNSTTHKVSLIENGQVKIICNTTDLGCGTGTVTLQNAYTNSTGGTTSEIIVDATRGGLDVQDRSTANGGTIGANLLTVRATAATDSTAGTALFSVGNTGSVLSQNSANSANAFRILNATGGELAGVDSTDSILRLLANNTGHLSGTGSNWNTGSALPGARKLGAAVAVNGYLYHIGGCDAATVDGDPTATVYYARANSDGTTGAWASTTSIPQTMCGGSATTYNGFIYVNGSGGSSANSRDVYYAKPNSDGTISSWTTQNDPTNYTIGLKDNGMAAYNGYLYITGGYTDDGLETNNRTVYYARINADGSVPTFTAQTLWLPDNDFNPGNTTIANGYLYVFGTANYDKFYYGRINADGSVAASAEATGTTGARKHGSIAVMNGYMYAIGGNSTAVNTVSYGALANNGDIAAFTTDTTTLPATRWLCSKNSPVVNNYIYLIGCGSGADTAQTTVYYAGGSRVKVGASLDLVGNSGEGMSEGGTGGQLTAGNTFVNGALTVTGNSVFKDGASVNNALNVMGTASVQTTTNTTTGFQILNASAVPQFVSDTTNSRIYIGNPTSDTTGALLVLDTKSDAGDPTATGLGGAMYYNSSVGAMRCYQDSFWRDCVTDNPRNSYHVYSDLNGSLDSSGNNQFDIQMYTEGTGANSTVTGVASHPGVMRKTASATNDLSAIQETSSASDVILLGNGNTWRYETVVRIPTVSDGTNSFVVRAGFLDSYVTADGGDGCYFRYSHDVNGGEWQGLCADTTTTTCDTNTAVSAGTWYRLTVVVSSDGATADFRINGTSTCTVSANIPDTTGNETGFANYIRKTLGATARNLDTDYIDVLGQFGTPR